MQGLRNRLVGGDDNNFFAFPPSCGQPLESLRAPNRQFWQICSLLTHFSAFGELVHAVNIHYPETLWRYMTLLWTRERAVTANNERRAFVHPL